MSSKHDHKCPHCAKPVRFYIYDKLDGLQTVIRPRRYKIEVVK